MRNFFGFDARVDALMEDAIKAIEAAGATVVDKANLPTRGQFGDAELEILLYEFKAGLRAYLATLGPSAPMKTLADVIAFNEAHAKEEMPYFGQELFTKAQAKGPLTAKAYLAAKAKAARLSRTEGLDVCSPRRRWTPCSRRAGSGVAHRPGQRRLRHGGSSGPAAVSGYPSITVPAGFVRGLPVGVSFIGPAWCEARSSASPTPTSSRRSCVARRSFCRGAWCRGPLCEPQRLVVRAGCWLQLLNRA